MKIAILGWGSLIWDPRDLKITDKFRSSGPILPLEFSRISKDGRLTLVLDIQGTFNQTYVATSAHEDLESALQNLYFRETSRYTTKDYTKDYTFDNVSTVDYVFRDSSTISLKRTKILAWLEATKYDAVIWTNLQSNIPRPFDPVEYFKTLPLSAKNAALEYVFKAPQSIITPYRTQIEAHYANCKKIFIP